MTVMIAGGLTFAIPGMEPAYAAGELSVSAEAVGNFAGIQVIEIVVDDPDRSETDTAQGVPNVEINGLDILMNQGNDGSWYGYIANNLAIQDIGVSTVETVFYDSTEDTTPIGGDAVTIFNGTTTFLKGFKPLSGNVANHPGVTTAEWPIIQTYDISDNSEVTITYGTGSTAETVVLTYDYDDSKDITLDRNRYPSNAGIILSLDDSLLNLSPIADDYWGFNGTKVYYFQDDNLAVSASNEVTWLDIGFEEGPLTFNPGNGIFSIQNTTIHNVIHEDNIGGDFVILSESDTNDNIFVNYDSNDKPNLITSTSQSLTGAGTIEYNANHSIILDTFNAIINLVSGVDEWYSGVEIDLELTDEDANLNTRIDEDLEILNGEVPYIRIGSPLHLDSNGVTYNATGVFTSVPANGTDSKTFDLTINATTTAITVNATWPYALVTDSDLYIFNYVNFDFTELGGDKGTVYLGGLDGTPVTGTLPSSDVVITKNLGAKTFALEVGGLTASASGQVYFDVLSFGQEGALSSSASGDIDDNVERVNDAFYRFALEETDDNTAKFTGSLEYVMINQLNVFDEDTYDSIETAADDIVIIVNDDLDGVDAVRVSYNDVISTGNDETISVQEDANTHTGSISFDKTSYSSGNTITVTVEDVDLNTDSDTPQIYTIDNISNWIGNSNVWLTQLTFDDKLYKGCTANANVGLNSTSFSLIETSKASGIFEGTLQLPTLYCDVNETTNSTATTNGVDIEFEYQDYSDASGNPNESSAKAAVSSNTGSVSLDKTVYGVPFDSNDFEVHPSRDTSSAQYLSATGTTLTISVNDPDHNASANGEDKFSVDKVKLFVKRGSDTTENLLVDETGSFVETFPQSGIFEYDFVITQSTDKVAKLSDGGAINQGDIISVEYTDDNDASGTVNTVTDSATFDLRNGVLQTDKTVYIIGTDAIITLIEPDLNLDSDTEETLSLDLIEWDSDAGTTTLANDVFNAQPAGLRETGPDTGIFQVVIEIPKEIGTDELERGERIDLEYIDFGPAGADFVGDEDEDITTIIETSDFGASIELDQKVYTWTDKVYVTIVAPDHNFDGNAIDEIGGDNKIVQVYTRTDKIKDYKFVETGPDTGIFTGEVILTGFTHDADGDGTDDIVDPKATGSGPTDGKLPSDNDDGITVTFEYSDNKVAQGSSLIRWNIGEVQFLEASYPALGSGMIRVIDPDMNLNPESVDSFDINVWSDSAAGGINLSVTETNEATGIFEGSIIFTTTDASSGSRLRVAEGDTVTAEYEDNTLPDPYSVADELDVTATTLIGTVVPPLERAPAANLRAVDAFGNSLDTVQVDQQIQITSDLSNNQDRVQKFAYLVQIQDKNGVTVSLSWITGELTPGQQLSPAVSWIPTHLGDYTATIFVWESVDNPTALSPPVSTTVKVNS
jgi:hypothetical protein